MKTIGVDADNGDELFIKGKIIKPVERIARAVSRLALEFKDTNFILTGNQREIERTIPEETQNLLIFPALKEYSPNSNLRRIKDSSLNNLVELMAKEEIDGFFSIGDTSRIGVELTALERSQRFMLPCLGVFLPSSRGVYLIADAGASVNTSEEQTLEHALAVSEFYKISFGKTPKLGILCNGTENHKGSKRIKSLDSLMKETKSKINPEIFPFDYVGKLEPEDASRGCTDILMTDGFTGNIYLKTVESTYKMIKSEVSKYLSKLGPIDKISLIASKRALGKIKKRAKERLDPPNFSGAILLGYNPGFVVKSHGISEEEDIYNGLKKTVEYANAEMTRKVCKKISEYKN